MSHSARSHSFCSDVPRVETGNLPGGGHAMVVIRDDRYMQSAGAARNSASTKASSSVLVFGDLSVMVLF
jgi:hypothetical protein